MLPILLYATLSFWFLTLMETSVVPFWMGDFVFLAIFVWSLVVAKYRQKMEFPIWGYWAPLVFGLGLNSFLFFSYWNIMPYLTSAILFTLLMTKRNKWIFRWKEGFGSIVAIFLVYAVIVVLIRREIMQYIVTIDFSIRFLVTLVLGLLIWGYFVKQAGIGKIR